MPKLEANLQWMFNEYDLIDRYDAAARAGFKGVELQAPYPLEIDQIVERLEKNDLKHVIINSPVSDPDSGINNIALRADRKDLYAERTAKAVEYASGLGCIGVNIGCGPIGDVDPQEAHETFIYNIRHAADELAMVGVVALVEPINTRDQPGFFVNTSRGGLDAIAEAGHPNLALLYDFYHMQIMEGELSLTVQEHLSSIKHIQIADNPGRHEPGTGEINYDHILGWLDEIGYDGWVGCEYGPSGSTEETLGWAKAWL
ncbi:MAG: hydroxypyruvate isomerase [Chloroflexi bacterium]|nr:hydroxypyruvate isomerase [Chloroflexota bacterium]|tara:strand:- start:8316 stop:9089 length:774 start_codon:yes stop_codon:yes gene_type:complete